MDKERQSNQETAVPSEALEHTRASIDVLVQHFKDGGSLLGCDTDALVHAMLEETEALKQRVITLELKVKDLEGDMNALKLLSGAPST